MQDILVSISCTTFNHERFIRECLDGFLMQKCNFKFEVLIHDDASTDNTIEIIHEYQLKFPEIIKPYIQKENQWSKGVRGMNAIYNYSRAKGKYIAMCEGDDYWTDSLKLQKQVDFLEANPMTSLSFGNAFIIDETNKYHKKNGNYYLENSEPQKINQIEALSCAAPTATMMFRRADFNHADLFNVVSGDYFLRLTLSLNGDFYYHGEVFASHRKHNLGISRRQDGAEWSLNTALNLITFEKICLPIQKANVRQKIGYNMVYAIFGYINKKDYRSAISVFIKLFFSKYFYNRLTLGSIKRLFIETIIKDNTEILDIF